MEYSARSRDVKDKRREDRFHGRKKFDSDRFYDSERPPYKGRPYKYGKEETGEYNGGSKKFDSKLSEESRLQSLVRRVVGDGDLEKRLSAVDSLKQYLETDDNAQSVCLHAEEAVYTLRDVFSERVSRDFKMEVAQCLGTVVYIFTNENRSVRFIDWLFPKNVSEDIRLFYLHAVTNALKMDKNAEVFRGVIQSTLNKCQSILENAGTPEQLEGIARVLILISKLYPMAFKRIFRDMVDILVGWHLDHSQRETVIQFTSNALISFQSFWSTDVTFTFNLLSQFLEDMETHIITIETKKKSGEDGNSVENLILKVASFMRAFTTVIRCLGNSSPVENQYLLEVFERLLKCASKFNNKLFHERTLELGNDCIRAIISKLGSMDCPTQDTKLFDFISEQATSKFMRCRSCSSSLLSLVSKLVDVITTKLPLEFLSTILGVDSIIPRMSYLYAKEMSKNLIDLYHSLMVLKSVPLIQEAYRLILCQLEIAYNTLLKSEEITTHSDNPLFTNCSLVAGSNQFAYMKYSDSQAEAVVIFNLRALVEIGNAKSNLIGMWALSPSLFTLFSNNLSPLNPMIAEFFPRVNSCIVEALYSHCCRHGHFILSSQLLSVSKESGLTSNSGHLSSILVLVRSLLVDPVISVECRCLTLKWALDIVEQLSPTKTIYSLKPFLQLLYAVIDCGFNPKKDISIAACNCLISFFTHSQSFNDLTIKSCIELSCIKLNSTIDEVRSAYLGLLKSFPLIAMQRLSSNSVYDDDEEAMLLSMCKGETADTYRKIYHNFMSIDDDDSFNQLNFVSAITFLLDKNILSRREFSSDWLARQYFTCQANKSKASDVKANKLLSSLVHSDSNLQWFWDVWQTAKFCVNCKLKTPLGNKPQDTFLAIENTLKYYAAWPKSVTSVPGRSEGQHRQRMLKVKLLLFFMECLEKNVYNAIEGCAVALPQSPKMVRSFFRTNRSTCREWLSRVRIPIIMVAQETGQWAQVVRQSFELLQDMKDGLLPSTSVEKILTYAVQALIELKAPNALEGLNRWATEILPGKDLTWIESAVQMASGRIESSVLMLKSCYKALTGQGSDGSINSNADEETHKSSMTNQSVVELIDKQVTENYLKIGSYEEALNWKKSLKSHSGHAASLSDITYNIQHIKNLMSFNLLDFEDFRSFSFGDATLKDFDEMKTKNDWRVTNHMKKADDMYMTAVKMLCDENSRGADTHSAKSWLSKCLTICEDVLCVTTEPKPVCINEQALILFNKTSFLIEQLEGNNKNLSRAWLGGDESLMKQCDGVSIASQLSIMNQCNIQQNVYNFMHPDKPVDLSNHLSTCRLMAVRHSRRHGNYNLCKKLLLDQMEVISASSVSREAEGSISTSDILNSLTNINGLDLFNYPQIIQSKMQIERQSAKLLHEQGETSNAIKTFCSSISYSMEFMRSVTGTPQKILSSLCEMNARSLVTLVSWLQTDNKLLGYFKQPNRNNSSVSTQENFIQHFKSLLENGGNDVFQWASVSDSDILSEMDILIKNLLNLSTTQCPLLAKSWFQLANWSYKWGRKAVDYANEDSFDLTANEKYLLLQTMPPGCEEEQLEKVTKIISQVHKNGENVSEDDITESNQMRSDDELDLVRRQLLSACPTLISHPDKIESLVNLWRTVVYRVYHHYKMSALSYFSFLKLNGTNNSDLKTDCNTTATLRLLRLLVKHSWGLRDVLEGGLAQSFTEPWKGIIPQLFSRLNHPEPYVRQSVTDLLCRVAKDTPHLIVYPAVVGYSSGKDLVREDGGKDGEGFWNEYFMKGNTGNRDDISLDMDIGEDFMSQDDDGGRDEVKYSTDVNSCFSQILETLIKVNPRMVNEVQLLVSELHRITLLWDELWVGALGQTCQDLHKRISHLEVEVVKVIENKNLSEEEKKVAIFKKHETILKPTIFLMEKLQEVTSQIPESAHEKWFQESFKERIKSAIELLKKPIKPRMPENSMEVFKLLLEEIQKKSHRHVHQQVLEMKNISPALSNLRETVIAMPGLSSKGELVTISGISNIVQILPTKTKPKKLVFIGSNGVRYPYLFKGLEDLHLDERIMQFLTIVNNMFSNTKSKDGTYRARHYSVTPLGARSGLIQWVDGATPMFSLYKKWFQREATAAQLKQMPNGIEPPQNVVIPRPSELYYNKLNPLLKEKGISTHNRKDWPVSILRRVLKELMAETPKDLLSKELWCYSGTSYDWWNVSQSYARSTAVMSMIGYVIGLGDRHLDNLLIDLSTGEVVHIDYNVCFEKGKSLRIPEKVPFRLTQNLQHALGLSGIEGTFRLSCEHVMKTMRQGKETLLTLLEAFVYDPLVDWTIGNEWCYTGAFYGGNHPLARSVASKQSRRELEREVTVSMFSIKMAENKHEWIANREDLVSSISKLELVMAKMCSLITEISTSRQEIEQVEKQTKYLKDALEVGEGHAIFSVQRRFLSVCAFESTMDIMKEEVEKQLHEQQIIDRSHKETIYKLKSKWISTLTQGLDGCAIVNPLMTFEPVVDFLQRAGQGSLVTQAESVYDDFNSAFLKQLLLMQEVVAVVHKYSSILEQLPFKALEFISESYVKKYNILAENLSLDSVQAVEAEVEAELSEKALKAQEAFELLDNLNKDYAEANKKYDLRVSERFNVSSEDQVTLLSKHEMSLASIHGLLEEPVSGALDAMKSVLVFNLCNIAKQILPQELTIYRTGLDALNIPSLDYFLAACSQANLLIQLSASVQDDGKMVHVMKTSEAIKMSLESARDLMFNFHTVIVPEAKQSLLTEEPTLPELISKLEMMSSELGPSLELVVDKLERQTSRFLQNARNDDLEVISLVEGMKLRFRELFENDKNKDGDLTRGQMLLTAMDGLFQKVFRDSSKLMDFLCSMKLPVDASHLSDVVHQADQIRNMVFDDNEFVSRQLQCLFFLHQFQTTLIFFRHCQQTTMDFHRGCQENLSSIHMDPIYSFLSKHIRNNIFGVTTQLVVQCINLLLEQLLTDASLADFGIDFLGSEVMNHCLTNQMATTEQMQYFHECIVIACDTLRIYDHSRCLDNYVEIERSLAQNKHQQLVALQWLHSNKFSFPDARQQDVADRSGDPSSASIRSIMLAQLKDAIKNLIVHQTDHLEPLKSPLLQVEKIIGQRLKWAAGANLSIATIQQKYEEMLLTNNDMIERLSSSSSELLNIGRILLNFEESSVQTKASTEMQNNFFNFLKKSRAICQSMAEFTVQLSPLEMELMKSDKLETSRKITKEWIQSSLDKLTKDEVKLRENITTSLEEHSNATDEMKKEVNKVRMVVSVHHRILSDMRMILKTMRKHEEYRISDGSSSSSSEPSVCDYLEFYVDFSSNFSNLLRDIYSAETLEAVHGQELLERFPLIKTQIIKAYNDLISLAAPLVPKKGGNVKGKGDKKELVGGLKKDETPNGESGTKVTLQLSRTSSTVQARQSDKIRRDPKTGKAIQERNSFAVGMWRKVKQKLEGKDIEGRGRLSIAEQVDYVIKEAMSLDNLAVLYEGWTPWV